MAEKNEINEVEMLDAVIEVHERLDILTQLLLEKKLFSKEELERKTLQYYDFKEN